MKNLIEQLGEQNQKLHNACTKHDDSITKFFSVSVEKILNCYKEEKSSEILLDAEKNITALRKNQFPKTKVLPFLNEMQRTLENIELANEGNTEVEIVSDTINILKLTLESGNLTTEKAEIILGGFNYATLQRTAATLN